MIDAQHKFAFPYLYTNRLVRPLQYHLLLFLWQLTSILLIIEYRLRFSFL